MNCFTDFLLLHIGTIGLLLDMIGVSIIFFTFISAGSQVVLADAEEEAIRKKKIKGKKKKLNIGFVLILIGFVLQVLSNELNISK